MDQQQDMDAAHGEALEIHAKAGRVRQVVEDIYRVALTYQETVDGILLQRRPSISWDTVSQIETRRRTGRVAPSVPHGFLKRDALTAEGERKIRKNSRKLARMLGESELVDVTFPDGSDGFVRVRAMGGDYGEAFPGYVVQLEKMDGDTVRAESVAQIRLDGTVVKLVDVPWSSVAKCIGIAFRSMEGKSGHAEDDV